MQMLRYFYFIAILLCAGVAHAQTNTLGDKGETVEKVSAHSSKKSKHSRRKQQAFYKRPKAKHTPEYEFYARIEKIAKEKKKLVKILSRPQYSNPLYFGHKRPPKKNEPHKRRYCKECGIRH